MVGEQTVATLTQMGQADTNGEDVVRQHSGWLIPLTVFVITAALSALILLYYIAPNPAAFIEQHTKPTTATTPVRISIDGHKLKVPANYIIYAGTRKGGARDHVALFAALPDFRGYSEAEAAAFADHSSNSPVVHILIRHERLNLPEAERLKRIYLSYVKNQKGTPGPFGLTQYHFRNDSGYRDEDLFVGKLDGHMVVMRCSRFTPDMANPNCLRDRRLSESVAMTYRFKRAHLGTWRQIATGVATLVSRFEAQAK
jgi:hypothetical protein